METIIICITIISIVAIICYTAYKSDFNKNVYELLLSVKRDYATLILRMLELKQSVEKLCERLDNDKDNDDE